MTSKNHLLGELLVKRRDRIIIDPNQEYKLVTIRLHHKGIALRSVTKGSDIKSKMSIIRAGDFLLSSIDARNGAFGIVPPDLDGAIVTNDFWCLEPNEKLLNREYLLLLSQTPYFDYICKVSSEGITQRIRLQKNKFFSFSIDIPSVPDQITIVKHFSHVRSQSIKIIEEIDFQNDSMTKLRQAFITQAMQGDLVPQDPNDEPASELLKRIKAEKAQLIKEKKIKPGKELSPIKPEEIPYPIPENWAWCRLGDLCIKIGSGSTPNGSNYTDSGIPFYRSQNVYEFGLVFRDITYISQETHNKMAGTHVLPLDLLLNITGGSIGRCAVVPVNIIEGNVSQHVCIIRPVHIDPWYLHYVVMTQLVQTYITDSTTGAGREGLPKYNLERFVIPVPPLSEQKSIVEKLSRLMQICDDLKASIEQSKDFNERLLKATLREMLEI